MGNKDQNKGSSWHKWDLHVHTPYTNLNKKYKCSEEEFIQKLCDSKIDCIGLTNYFKFNKEEFELKEKIEKRGIKVFYNLEVRLDYQNKEDQCLDFHIIFSDKVTQQEIDNFLRNADANVGGTEKKLADLEKDDFDKAVVNFDQLLECLEKESLKLRGKYLLGFLSRGHGSSRSSSNYEKIVKKVHFLIHSSDKQENLKKDREYWLKYNKPLIQSSDAHEEKQIGNKYTWIKAEKTFEGLKQIIYEPETRVSIDKEKSQDPLYKIDSVGLNFDEEVKTTNEQDDTPFCYAGFNETLFFSPYFTCVIGGRGSGKSTLLQLIASAIKNKSFVKGLKHETIQKYIEIQPDIDIIGQKCTAVLVVLLSLGNNPIIIDEPEAHLDSALIANYLVTLIKKQKQKRQIIFATHNANFVLNADVELIIQLKNENNKIVAQSFMIESDAYKEDLLKLEGGEKAFKDRERKYGITKDKN
ncbi:ATPase [Helicobacter pylori]|uniref:AAA family ATPase n=1 Tax=Helicobacter pylori TaxID=210 RepID=UPI000FDF5157|nr:PHP-associated domain-containing protein [Helicobacter pylori]RVY82475.1 ATPase [Helicobacter pylori]WQW84736.1 AAA family ATPase [Helicobacter pylori]